MILDKKLLFGKNVSINGAASVVTSMTDAIQVDAAKDQFGAAIFNDTVNGGGVMLNIRVGSTQLAASSAAATVQINLYERSTGSSIKSGSLIHQTVIQNVNKASSILSHCKVGGYLLRTILPAGIWGDTTNKYIGVTTKIIGQTVSTGTITAWLGLADGTVLP